ncbi:MAG: type II toxin-antitoxin system RelE/ParE family toxin [Beijerinckiaceae bacterium]|nr:type II toxin-antitoxin system RelE/ParE family toxin [Beijerinckiaceae bacterium]
MKPAFLRPQAKADLRRIAQRSKREWGVVQAKSYVATINAAIARLQEMPESGVECSDLLAGCRRCNVGAHSIFYCPAIDRIDVIRILHQRMDAGRYLA